MSRRLISATLVGLTLTLGHASVALGDHSLMQGETSLSLSGGSVLMALITSFVTFLVCYALMVSEPNEKRK